MKTYLKTILRAFKKNTAKIISISIIIFLGVGFVSGLLTLSPNIKKSFANNLEENNVSDIIAKSTSNLGFQEEEIEQLQENENVSLIETSSTFFTTIGNKPSEVYQLNNNTLNKPILLHGQMPTNSNQILVEQESDAIAAYQIGQTINFNDQELTICGIVQNPLIFNRIGELNNNNETIELIIYVTSDFMVLPITDLYIKIDNDYQLFSNSYKKNIRNCIDELKDINPSCIYLSLENNKSYATLESYCDKLNVITFIFPLFFILICALVVLTTMTRMIEEERMIIGCYKTLGVSDNKIKLKYIILSLSCCIIASVLGMCVGLFVLPNIIYPAFNILFFLPQQSSYVLIYPGLISSIAMTITVVLVTYYVINKALNASPASLLLPPSPKSGKKTILEFIPFIWKKLSFKYKSSFRNVFRYLKHLIMTVISVAGSSALVFAGFALLNISNITEGPFKGMSESITPISFVVIIFALLLCVFVIYNLTNMNIGERNREIATLKVLGYHGNEVCGYIYREILIMAIIGLIFGIPLGCGLIKFIITYLEFGSFSDIKVYSYFLTIFVVLLFIGIVDLLLIKKILRVDMNNSLKSVD